MIAYRKFIQRIAFCVTVLIATSLAPLAAQTAAAKTREDLIQILMQARLIKYEHFYALNGTVERVSGAPTKAEGMKGFVELLKKCDPKFVSGLPTDDPETVLHASKLVIDCEYGGVDLTVTIYNSSVMYVSDGAKKSFWHLTGDTLLPFELVKQLKSN